MKSPRPENMVSVTEENKKSPKKKLNIHPVYALKNNFTRRIINGYHKKDIWTHLDTYDRLCLVNEELRKKHGLEILLKDGYRPNRASQYINNWARQQ